jgi:hypothetical protein
MELHSIGIDDASFGTMSAHCGSILVTNIGLENMVLRRCVEIRFSTYIGDFES